MKILVLGGSYFYGRVFTMLAAGKHELTLLNRGTYSMKEYHVREIAGDRRQEATLQRLNKCGTEFDAVVDFCGYETGDIRLIAQNLPKTVRQYIFISTVDVYRRGIAGYKKEETPYEERGIAGESGAYIRGKISLEEELKEVSKEKGFACTILRPAILYGPYNYAPRESVFIQLMVQNHVLPRIVDAAGKFQFVYVKDAAQAVCQCLLNDKTYGQAYNLCGEEEADYQSFADSLECAVKSVGGQMPGSISLTAQQAQSQGIPLPFPLYPGETELYSNEKSKIELGIIYTPLSEGMKKTYQAFRGVFA